MSLLYQANEKHYDLYALKLTGEIIILKEEETL